MTPQWHILYRGPLSSCNYECGYCPFAKTRNTAAELAEDATRLERFVTWVAGRSETIGILFTPWGEALHHRHYQQAIVQLSHLPNVHKVAIQTNLAAKLDWLSGTRAGRAALWTTYHPTQTPRARFLAQCAKLDELGIAHSIGVVGKREQIAEIEQLRAEANPATYLWVNAYKRQADYYTAADLQRLTAVDPLFALNTRYHPSAGLRCRAGHSAFTVDGEGNARRCHFIKTPIGNIYEPGFGAHLSPEPAPCTNATCGCHIGYIHLETLDLYQVFGPGLLERIPVSNVKPPHPMIPCPSTSSWDLAASRTRLSQLS